MSASPARLSQATLGGLRSLADCGGCAAKASPELVALLAQVAAGAGAGHPDAAVLAGLNPSDDAAVYRLDDERAIVSTLDFFPPMLNDPAEYGAVAAANAVSDVYAMGGEVAFALIISGFPQSVPQDWITATTAAATAVVNACGAQIVGGHSIRCAEPVFGLSVTGFVHPARIWRKSGAKPGDALVLSKPLGTGVLLSEGSDAAVGTAVASMRHTNRSAMRALAGLKRAPSAVTDITGYGLLGHAVEVAERSGVVVRIHTSEVPLLPGALAAAHRGARTSADAGLRATLSGRISAQAGLAADRVTLHYDPQTSGGLLAAIDPEELPGMCEQGFVRIGRIEDGAAGVILE